MKKYSKWKKLIILLIICIMGFSPVLVGCNFGISSIQLDTPIVTLYSDSKCITWDSVDNAGRYDIYINGKRVDSISSSDSINSRLFDYSPYLSEEGTYSFSVIARKNRRMYVDSEVSQAITYTYKLEYGDSSVPIPTDTSIVESEDKISTSITGTRLEFQKLSTNVDEYILYLYSASTGLNAYSIPENVTSINLQSETYALKDEIYAVRVGYSLGNQKYVSSDIEYINPDNYSGYTDKIYTFDGYIYDYYIEDLVELRNIVYYSLIYRLSSFEIKLSNKFENNIISTYNGESGAQRVSSAIIDCFNYIYETRNQYTVSCKSKAYSSKAYIVDINYDSYLNKSGLPACENDNTYIPSEDYYYNELDWVPSYRTTSLTLRCDDSKYEDNPYDDFASDKQFVYTEVSSSEELYWAVENKVTPICEEDSMAERIYAIAKDVLREIISDDMTDYEKALAIFDWISISTEYDYFSCNSGETYDTASATNIPVYYLEGVFITGYAVCDGYSKAFSLLCNMEGIDCIRVVGTAVSGSEMGGHAWNKVLIDKYEDDGIDAEYYLVDITWSALTVKSTWNEVSSHMYFLISDYDVSTTHYAYALREKFFYYDAGSKFDYYNYQTFTYQGKEYTLVIDSDPDAEAVFDYMFYSQVDTMEIVLDYNYMKSIYNKTSNRPYASYSAIVEATLNKLQTLKFPEQSLMIYTNYNSWELVRYTNVTTSGGVDSGKGVIIVFKQSLYIDGDNEVGHLINELNTKLLVGSYDLYVTEEMLGVDINNVPENSDDAKAYYEKLVNQLFLGALNTYGKNISVTFTFEGVDGEIASGTTDVLINREYLFKMNITKK